jgi:hypothetical protein
MLKRLTRKLLTLSMLVVALAAVSSTPASSASSRRFCYEAPIETGCVYLCCDFTGNCWCQY